MTISEIEDFIVNDDESLFHKVALWKLHDKKQDIFNLCSLHNANKCLEKYIETIGIDFTVLIKNSNLSYNQFEEIFKKDEMFILDGDFDRSDKLAMSLQFKNLSAFEFLTEKNNLDMQDILGFSFETADNKDEDFFNQTTAYYAIKLGLLDIILKLIDLHKKELQALDISIKAVHNEVKTYNCESDISALNELTFYQYFLEKGLNQMQEYLKLNNLAA